MASKILALCKALHTEGVRVSFDPNIRKELLGSPAYFDTVSALVDISSYFLPSEDDAEALFPGEPLESFAPKLFAKGTQCVVLKRGEKGAAAIHRDGESHSVAAHKVTVADPTGAGDCFCGTFVTLIASGFAFRDALDLANAAGALAVTKVGPMEGNRRSPISERGWRPANDVAPAGDRRREPGGPPCRHSVLVHGTSRDLAGDPALLPGQRTTGLDRGDLQPGQPGRRLYRDDGRPIFATSSLRSPTRPLDRAASCSAAITSDPTRGRRFPRARQWQRRAT